MLFGVDKTRLVSVKKGSYCQIQDIQDWPKDGQVVYLKDFGMVRVFRQTNKNVHRYYIMAMPKIEQLDDLNFSDYERVHSAHWNIEQFHRAVKQLCNIEKFQVRKTQAIHTHIFCSLVAFINLELLRLSKVIKNWYQLKKEKFIDIIKEFICVHKLNAFLEVTVNA